MAALYILLKDMEEDELISMLLSSRERIGKHIAEARKARGMTIRELAELSHVNYANICKIENGKYNVSIDILSKISNALKCEVDVIVNSEVKPIHYRQRRVVELVIGRDYYVSFGNNKAEKCTLVEVIEDRNPMQVKIEISSVKGRTRYSVFADEIGNTPEEAVLHEVTC